ncbi:MULTISPECIES: UDP-N-acetyl-D-mannosamine dehydrogenase [Micrococcus]|uniref:UDP-N-acetyl-D-mannosamine dehydrogenase n=1 Tax=Micrococcus TaxID=1269 RepID=UPI0004E2C3F4|nr:MULTISPECIES: UDP-N-acetyl-D-mannosamine dehydrogenase [Micrococcus]CVN05515.1 UDP-glucose 6-dehydrogenase [Streptococcus pneumoniae]KFC53131.1 UDP-N-acetyl-D-mannosaminuronic acid dehydrogenase [Micrococcus luteus]KYK00902.1 UDP-N-acetyl-D-mannosaminuronic acid dehydrogenase [Micrococcus sp. CH3]KYK06279.1 UDP-N-acetyl-D-mannosaminuronic acid dehydrogenase [Micrococcus sp. CH7]MBS9537356.1 UDP-N-acetyl-D-mannosamine dehydrogenase [Micrococcus luteus]
MTTQIKDVAVIGLGYIGLPTAAILAENGVRVHGVDVSQRTVDAVNAGTVPFVEPDLADFVERNVKAGRLSASLKTPQADAYIVAVPTPFKDGHSPDLGYIEAAARGLAPQLRGGELVILESTSPPGATEHMAAVIREARPDLDGVTLDFAHCPERVLPGRVMIELVTNDRIVGGSTPEAAQRAKQLYEAFCQGEILVTDCVTAEMAKLVENSFRDVNIAFANELSLICSDLGIDVWELIELANHHPRVNILQPGPGVGGHCIAVDPWFIVDAAPQTARIIRAAREINDGKPKWVVDQAKAAAFDVQQATGRAPVVAVLGLAFKPNIDDLRESPALNIAIEVAQQFTGSRILVVEPHVEELPAALAGRDNVELVPAEDGIREADVVLLLVDHDAFASLGATTEGKKVIDTRGQWR